LIAGWVCALAAALKMVLAAKALWVFAEALVTE